jgi:hypothetical protein
MEFNINPYYDDFEQNAKDNNYLRVLFKPGFSVQARELTQMQSILQNQIKAFGDHIFADGSPVIGGNITVDNKVNYIKLDDTYNNVDIEVDDFNNKIIVLDSNSITQAKVLAVYYPSGGTPTLMIKYLSGTQFADGDVIKVAGTTTKARCINSAASGRGTTVSINDGIFYVNGFFVTVNEQTSVASAYDQYANVKIGLEISDSVVDYTIDSTLLDPAQSSFNYQAPGADRYQFNLNLTTRPLDTAVDESAFYELMRLENGVVTKQVKYPIYSEIEKTLARRTYDESGDYTVTPFRAYVSASSNANNYIINIDPGKAYIKGFEFETIGTYKLETQKPRSESDSKSLVDIDVDTSYGNYLKFKNFRGNSAIDLNSIERVDLHCVKAPSVTVGGELATANTILYSASKIGTAGVRGVQRDSYSVETADSTLDGNGLYRVYFTDISITPKVVRTGTGSTSSTINLGFEASTTDNAYSGVVLSFLPLSLTPVPNVTTANVFAGSTRVNANSTVTNTFGHGNVSVGDIIRVGNDVRRVVGIDVSSNNFLFVNAPFTETIIGTNQSTNPLYVYKQTAALSNVSNQTRTIRSYVGSTRTATLDSDLDNFSVPAQNTVVQLNYNIRDLESFVEGNPTTATSNAYANVSVMSKIGGELGYVDMFEPSDSTLVYKLPNQHVRRGSLSAIDFMSTKYLVKTGASGVFVVDNGNGLDSWESIPWAITNSNIEDNIVAVVRNSSNQTAYPNGSILRLSTAEVVASGSGIQITTSSAVGQLELYINVKESNADSRIRQKTLRSNPAYTTSPFNYPTSATVGIDHTVTQYSNTVAKINVTNGLIFITDPGFTKVDPGDTINLYVPDLIKIRKILKGTATAEATSANYTDITDHFSIDYGQRDALYDHAKLVLRQGYPSPAANLTIHADFFTHTLPAGGTYFSVDSYSQSMYDTGEIPVYISPKAGVFYLRDCLDFRPIRQIGTANGNILVPQTPAPDASTELNFSYYLPRIDKLVLTKNKEFKLIKGASSPTPTPPADISDAMTLYTIYVPPYVYSTNDIRLKFHDHKRYTMRDIARIEKRVDAIEYYTSLNSVENQALEDSVQYSSYTDATEKEKYGIVGEGFKNYNIADYKNPDFTVSMSPGMMLPMNQNKIHSIKDTGLSNVKKNQKTYTLSYTEVPAISQNVTSNKIVTVQPFLFATFNGDVKLTPDIDCWVSEELAPEVIRGPEVTRHVKEIKTTEVIREIVTVKETIIERERLPTITTCPTPVVNTTSVVVETVGSDPVAPVTEDQRPVESANTPVIIVADTVQANVTQTVSIIDPVVYLPATTTSGGTTEAVAADLWGSGTTDVSYTVTPSNPETLSTTTTIPISGTNRGRADGGGFGTDQFETALNFDRA